jgi:hypothetical protein
VERAANTARNIQGEPLVSKLLDKLSKLHDQVGKATKKPDAFYRQVTFSKFTFDAPQAGHDASVGSRVTYPHDEQT